MSTVNSLLGVSVVLTRTQGRSAELAVRLKSLGASVIEKPLIETRPILNDSVAKMLSSNLSCDGVIVTSANAVRKAFAICQYFNSPWVLGDLPWYCIGKATAHAAKKLQMNPILFENVRNGQEFAKALGEYFRRKKQKKVAFLHGQKADLTFVDELQSAGIDVSAIPVYETVDVHVDIDALHVLQNEGIAVYVFYSPSAVESLLRQWPDFTLSRTKKTFVVTIGNTTSTACTQLNVLVDMVAARPTMEALIDAITRVIEKQKPNLGGGK